MYVSSVNFCNGICSWCDGVESMLRWDGLQRRNWFCAGSSVKLEQFVCALRALRTETLELCWELTDEQVIEVWFALPEIS